MIRTARVFMVFLLLAAVETPPAATAQDATAQDGAAFKEAIEEGRAARQRYVDRIGELQTEVSRQNARLRNAGTGSRDEQVRHNETILALARLHASVGQYVQAVELLKSAVGQADATSDAGATNHSQAATADTGEMRALLGRLLLHVGRHVEAESVLAAARSRQGGLALATVRLAEVYFTTGRTEEGLELCREVLRDTGTQGPANAPNLLAAGLAARYLELSHEANSFLAAATRVDSEHLDAYVAWGRLFLDKHNRAEATGIFEDALKIDSGYPPALIGLAEALAEKQPLPAEAVVRKALAINPSLMEGRHFLAGLHLTDEAYDNAIGQLDQALEVNPESPGTHALLAAAYHGQGRQAEFEAARQRVMDINPSYGRMYEIIANHLTRRYRFRESVEMGRRAIETDPALWSAYAGLGISLTRVGEMDEARRMLEQAFDRDPFDTRTYNTLELLDSFEDFETRESGPFILKIHRDEDAVYGKLALDLLEEAHRTIAPRYGFTPGGHVHVEMLPDNDDFMVRIAGVPGTGGLLGVCFGEVVVANSPRARPKGTFNWGQTLWHEYVHVTHLQQTRNRIPRWLAEGIAVYETRLARPEWDMDLEAEFTEAAVQGELLAVSELNRGFTRPKSRNQIVLSYYQASIVVEYMVDTFGFEAVRSMLDLYNRNRTTAEVVREVTGRSMEDFDRAFADYTEKRIAGLRRVLQFKPSRDEKPTMAELEAMAADHPESFYAHLMLGQALHMQKRYEEAITPLERARTLFANYTHAGSPHALLAEIYLEQGNTEAAMEALEALTAVDEDDIESCKTLAGLYAGEGRRGDALRILERAVMIDPFDAEIRKMRAGLYERDGRPDLAVPEYEAVLAVETTDRVQAQYDLARAYLAAGRKDDARKAALKALEDAPGFEAAQEVLLRSLE
ncbi:MAG: tetratricopeptide repeat protein [Gemmatimonadetes bacterium]|nr:tetratricopeptide repeat protein [Gemmatimonadota bacterium]MYD24480.1 tetratricopeptide repeat protein [Gemmatimonadota bacterium]MYI99577.1 tetratricopeptide repeat protein [Gemmatimonadota bacterium]